MFSKISGIAVFIQHGYSPGRQFTFEERAKISVTEAYGVIHLAYLYRCLQRLARSMTGLLTINSTQLVFITRQFNTSSLASFITGNYGKEVWIIEWMSRIHQPNDYMYLVSIHQLTSSFSGFQMILFDSKTILVAIAFLPELENKLNLTCKYRTTCRLILLQSLLMASGP